VYSKCTDGPKFNSIQFPFLHGILPETSAPILLNFLC